MANYLHVPLAPDLLLRLGTTAAARGMSVKAAASEAVTGWVKANAEAVQAVADASLNLPDPRPQVVPVGRPVAVPATVSGCIPPMARQRTADQTVAEADAWDEGEGAA
jgi:hypothetical protein